MLFSVFNVEFKRVRFCSCKIKITISWWAVEVYQMNCLQRKTTIVHQKVATNLIITKRNITDLVFISFVPSEIKLIVNNFFLLFRLYKIFVKDVRVINSTFNSFLTFFFFFLEKRCYDLNNSVKIFYWRSAVVWILRILFFHLKLQKLVELYSWCFFAII